MLGKNVVLPTEDLLSTHLQHLNVHFYYILDLKGAQKLKTFSSMWAALIIGNADLSKGLKPNFLLAGPASIGKTYIIERLKELLITGIYCSFTSFTSCALQSGSDRSGNVNCTEEVAQDFLDRGEIGPMINLWKTAFSSGNLSRNVIGYIGNGTVSVRKPITYHAFIRGNFIICLNVHLDRTNTALLARMIVSLFGEHLNKHGSHLEAFKQEIEDDEILLNFRYLIESSIDRAEFKRDLLILQNKVCQFEQLLAQQTELSTNTISSPQNFSP